MEGLRVLLVDDEVEFVSTLAERLEIRGMEVLVASDGEEALRRVEQEPLDVVVLDVKMPGMDGIEALGRIKAIDPLPEVIILTGHANVDAAVEIMRLGGYEYLLKPCPIEDLAAKIDGALEKKRARERLHGGP